jgi:RimK family alpha-L-glutamate ligase
MPGDAFAREGRRVTLGAATVAVVAWVAGETNGVLVQAWRDLGLPAVLVRPPEARDLLAPGDVAVVRLDVLQTLDGVEEGLAEIDPLSHLGVRIVNTPDALLAAHDKLETARCLDAAGVPHPGWEHVLSVDELRERELSYVVKPRFGSWGRDVFRCRTVGERDRCVAAISRRAWFRRHGALVQDLVPRGRHDLRLLVAGGKVVGAAERRAAPGEWRTNVSLGGSLVAATPPEEASALGLAAARAIGADFMSVDLLPVKGGHIVIELNGAPDFDERYSLPGQNVFADTADSLGLRAERPREPSAVNPPTACHRRAGSSE